MPALPAHDVIIDEFVPDLLRMQTFIGSKKYPNSTLELHPADE